MAVVTPLLLVHLLIYSKVIKVTKAAEGKKESMLKGWQRVAGREGAWEGGKTTGSSSAVINLGSDTGLRGLASTAPHNWVTHRGRPTQAIMW